MCDRAGRAGRFCRRGRRELAAAVAGRTHSCRGVGGRPFPLHRGAASSPGARARLRLRMFRCEGVSCRRQGGAGTCGHRKRKRAARYGCCAVALQAPAARARCRCVGQRKLSGSALGGAHSWSTCHWLAWWVAAEVTRVCACMCVA